MQGVTITAFQSTGGASETLIVDNDQQATQDIVASFVESYNALVQTFDTLTAYDPESEIASPLLGDATLRGIRDQVRRELSIAVADIDADFSTLAEVGVETQLDGSLKLNSAKLTEVLDADFVKFGQLFANSDGFAVRLHSLVDGFLGTGGIIETRTQGLTSSIEDFSDQRVALSERLASLETRLLRQFNALDSLLGELNSTSNFLNQQLNSLPGFTPPDSNG